MPTISLPSKYLQDGNQTKFAPITTPDAVRFPNGDNLNDRLGGWTTIPAPSSSDEGKVLSVDSNGDYQLDGIGHGFTHAANTTVSSPFTFTCAANQRNSQMITIGANLTLNITCNNGSDNYLWIINSSSSTDIDVVIGTVTYNGNILSASSIYLPSDGITVPKSGLCEMGIIMNADGCIITSRNDLVPSV